MKREIEETIWLVTYKGQTESPYTWATLRDDREDAVKLKEELEKQYPDRVWSVDRVLLLQKDRHEYRKQGDSHE
jgi:hypothetical protein